MSNLIGLGGYAYSGKDSFADVLKKDHGWYKTYMSKYLREALETLNPLVGFDSKGNHIRFREVIEMQGYDEAKKFPEIRYLLQMFGTEVGRNMFGEDFWIRLCMQDVIQQLNNHKNVVITGIRYPNELHAIRNQFGISIWVKRPGYLPVNEHSSDNSLAPEDFDYIFTNDADLESLNRTVPVFLKNYIGMAIGDEWQKVGRV